MRPLVRVAPLIIILALAGCGDDGNPMGPGGDVDLPGILPPDPNGMLLGGGETDPARDSLLDLAPSAVEPADIVDGFLTTRLTAMVAPAATVLAVNAALEAQGARIVSMSRTSPFVTLKIPAVSDPAAARTAAGALVATGAFLYAAPAHSAKAPESPGSAFRSTGARGEAPLPHHLQAMRMPAAWNATELALANNDRITVIVPDEYASLISHADIDAQAFVGYGGPNPLPGPEIYPGNNGFAVAGIIGANADEIGATGINPDPVALLDIDSMALGGLTWFDIFNSLSWRLATSGNRFVLNTGIAYLDPDFVTFSAVDRAMHVLAWRVAAAIHYHQFVHVVAAGQGYGSGNLVDEALLRSPFLAAAHFDDVREMVDLAEAGTADSLALETAWQDMVDSFPLATAIANNVVVVGSAVGSARQSFPAFIPDYVEATGVNVLGPCVSQDPASSPGYLCDGEVAVYSGTAMAAAQVSGLAAYLMNLSDASPVEVRNVLRHAYESSGTGIVDAYHAILALDGAVNGDVRRSILDVAGFQSTASDGDFDAYDLPWLAPAVSESAGRSGGGGAPPLRYDLNGDGVVGGLGTQRFDLNADRSYGTVSQSIEGSSVSFDENAVTDFEVLCYYAYSALYNGEPEPRQQFLAPNHGGPFLEFLGFPDEIIPGEPTEITVRAGLDIDGVITYLEGIVVEFDASNGGVDVSSVLTGPGGLASTNVTLDLDENEVLVQAEADIGDGGAAIEASIIRPNEVQIVSRSVYMIAEVAFGYTQEVFFQWIFDNYDWIDQVDPFTAVVDTSITKGGSATAVGMTATGTITTTQQSSVDLYEGDHFAGCSFDATIDGNLSLTNPNLQIPHYQCQSEASSEMEVEFVVWGTAAEFNMHGTVSAKYYDVELNGPDGNLFECNTGDAPCFTISTGGTLGPGEYRLSIDIADDAYFGEHCDEEPSCTQSGSETQESSLSLDLSVMPH